VTPLDKLKYKAERPGHEAPFLPVEEDLESSMVVFLNIVSFVLVLGVAVFSVALLG
jgi:hypothetical protein